MKQENYEQLERKKNGMLMVLEFPKEAPEEENIKREVKEILCYVLQEYFAKYLL